MSVTTTEEQLTLTIPLLELALHAGDAILEVYDDGDFETERKDDDSPLTLADRRAHELIDAGLARLTPHIPVLSEEGDHADYAKRRGWEELWLVDPLDGTKEFIKRNGEFTVNIALVQRGEPVLGVVYAPVRESAWVGVAEPGPVPVGAWTVSADRIRSQQANTAAGRADAVRADAIRTVRDIGTPVAVRARDTRRISIIASRTHLNRETQELIDRLGAGHETVEIVNVGSSLKLCYIAEGRADIYPRYAPTSEWDTAAGHALVRGAGGEIYQAGPNADPAPQNAELGHSSLPLRYNKENLLNPWFVARAW